MNTFTVAKFGGTSVANYHAMSCCAAIIQQNPATRIVVISACSGVTNLLVELANGVPNDQQRQIIIQQLADIHYSIINSLDEQDQVRSAINDLLDTVRQAADAAALDVSKKLTDHLVACGELMSTYLLTQLLRERGIAAVRFDIRQVMRTDDHYGRAEPQLDVLHSLINEQLLPLCQQQVVVTQGFIGADQQGNTTTLGRGGSDYSAALIAEAINANGLEIWTDVPGIYTTDPRIAAKAAPIAEISFSEASEMANFGAKILHPSTLVPAIRHGIPVFVGSSQAPQEGGTWIRRQVASTPLFRALTLRGNQTMVTLRSVNMFHAYGFLAKVFEILARHKISVDLITTSEISVSLTLDKTDTSGGHPELPIHVRQELAELCTVEIEHDLCLVALIGNKMKQRTGYAKQVFGVLDEFNIRMICYGASAHNLCFLVHSDNAKSAVQKLHQALLE